MCQGIETPLVATARLTKQLPTPTRTEATDPYTYIDSWWMGIVMEKVSMESVSSIKEEVFYKDTSIGILVFIYLFC